jgi:hypothetical protein
MTPEQFCWTVWITGVLIILGIVWLAKWRAEKDENGEDGYAKPL